MMSAIFNVSSGLDTKTRWVANRSSETWKVKSKQTSIVINGIVDMDSRQVDTAISQETFTDHTAGGYREWEVNPGQILEIIYQLNSPKFHWWSNNDLDDDYPLRLKDHNNVYVNYDWRALGSNEVRVGAKLSGTEDMLRLNYPSYGDVVIWGATHESGKGTRKKERWIQNRSSATWKFYGHPSTIIIDGFIDPARGKVDYTISSQYTGTTSDEYIAWEVKPGQTLQIMYRLDYDDTRKLLAIRDHTGHLEVRSWKTTSPWYKVWPDGAKIELDGHQDPVNLNHPAEGDIDMYGNQWS